MAKHLGLAITLAFTIWATSWGAPAGSIADRRAAADKQFTAGNYRDAWELFRDLALDRTNGKTEVGYDLDRAVQCLRNLAREDEADEFREQVIALHANNWQLLSAAANSYLGATHYGYTVAGKFYRGEKRGGGEMVSSLERDRVRALQLMQQALPIVKAESDHAAASGFYLDFARQLLQGRGYLNAWELQALTDLSTLPDYEKTQYFGWWPSRGQNPRGAPVDAEGNPVFHHKPESYETAKTDGERWRWCLDQAAKVDPNRSTEVHMTFANFLHEQFGVQTMRYYGRFFGPHESDDPDKDESGPYALHTLGEKETIAKLATGVKRFQLPDEFNFIRIYQQVAGGEQNGYAQSALETLAQIFENRRQYPRAAEYWRKNISQFGPGSNNYKRTRLNQIVGNWGRFERSDTQPAGKGSVLDFRFRNGKKVHLEAKEVKVEKLLDDVKIFLKSNPQRLDWDNMNIGDLGHRLVVKNQNQYVGEKVADWDVDLEARNAHFDRRISITTPLQKPGAYLVTARMEDGNTSRIVVWIADTVIVKKPINDAAYYFVADAVTGKPVPKAHLDFFGFWNEHIQRNEYRVRTRQFAEFADADGQVIPDQKDLEHEYQWLVIARNDQGRFAYLGFDGVWYGRADDTEYNATKVFVATDRPVYRPDQSAKYKFWVRHAKYDMEDVSDFENKKFKIRITNPLGENVFEREYLSDAYAGFEGEYAIPKGAALGQYSIAIVEGGVDGGGSFRVEEYKKPEFEVTVEAPTEPVALGDKVTATIRAKYYFGAPVTKATVHYKVQRTNHAAHWYPVGLWDWFYGPGYWWFAYDYDWYPGWKIWGCMRPYPFWWPARHDPPEVVADAEVPIGEDGTFKVEIDTSFTKAIHGDLDHQYEVTAEVVDASRRTIVGKGNVLVARSPFKVFSWVDRGYYRAGDAVKASFKAQTLDQKPVAGKGILSLYKITYDANAKPVETLLENWNLDTNERGEAELQIKAADPGQYRLSYKVTDSKEHTVEGGYLVTVIGQGNNGSDFRFNDIELVTEKREYSPGETVRLMINTNRVSGTVVLFVRPTNGIYPRPQIIRLTGKSTIQEIGVVKKDMPNFFIEAFTISGGKVFTETREVIVPPEKRVVNVDLAASATEYKPGTPATVKVKLTDIDGKPIVGQTALSIYDKSVDYISGGSNVPEIREFFWKWRRSHHPYTLTSLQRISYNLLREKETPMGNIGVFGDLMMDEGRDALKEGVALGGAVRKSMSARDGEGAMPPASAAPMDALEAKAESSAPGAEPLIEPTVRTQFADTAYWAGSVIADENGMAEIALTMPENLTTWKIRAWTMSHGTKVGQGESEVITTKKLLVRLQAPRFFVEKDEVVLTANVHNYLPSMKSARVVLELEGNTLQPVDAAERTVEIPAGGEQRVDWRVKVTGAGEAIVRMKALTDEESDAMQMKFPVRIHGMLKTESYAGAIRPDKNESKFEIRVPGERRINESRLEIRYSPTLAGAMVDALPYLVSYPHETTDCTLNRFLPTVITQNILKRMQIDLEAVKKKRINLNAQEIGDDPARAEGWKRYDHNPVFDNAEVERMVKQGVKALTEMQLSDGGWGWFWGWGEYSSPHQTALIVHGLQLAAQNDVALAPGVLDKGIAWLKNYQVEQVTWLKNYEKKDERGERVTPYKQYADNIDALVYMVLADAGVSDANMRDFLYRDRSHLSVYAKAMYGLALHKENQADKLAMILQNIDQYLVQDDENQTAYLKMPEGSYWWFWYDSEVEANAYYLKLLAKTKPKGDRASRLVKYLINNRKHATYWNSTRDTAIAIEALAEYLTASGEDKPDMTLEVWLDGKKRKEVKIDAENLFSFDNKFVLEGDAVETGVHTVELKRQGTGPVYFCAYLTNFTLEDPITAAGLEIKVNRKYYKLVRKDKQEHVAGSRGQVIDQRVEKYDRVEIPNLGSVTSGDLVEIELEIDSKNDYEHLLFEDKKAAGFEPFDVQSGYNSTSLGAYVQLRDEQVTFFVRRLARGKHSVSYRMRAETPGKFSALPTIALGMYAPELRGNSDEIKVLIEDRPTPGAPQATGE